MTADRHETQCPACQTVFWVEDSDLDRADGRVRCGDCLTVFDAREHLIPLESSSDLSDNTVAPESPDAGAHTTEAPTVESAPDADSQPTSEPSQTSEPTPAADAPSLSEPGLTTQAVEQTAPELSLADDYDQSAEAPVSSASTMLFSDDMSDEELEAQLKAITGSHEALEIDTPAPVDSNPALTELAESVNDSGSSTDADDDWGDLLEEFSGDDFTTAEPGEAVLTLEQDESVDPVEVEEPTPASAADTASAAGGIQLEPEPDTTPEAVPERPASATSDLGTDLDLDVADSALMEKPALASEARLDFQLIEDDQPGASTGVDLDLSSDSESESDHTDAASLDVDLSDDAGEDADAFNADAMATMFEASDIFQSQASNEQASAPVIEQQSDAALDPSDVDWNVDPDLNLDDGESVEAIDLFEGADEDDAPEHVEENPLARQRPSIFGDEPRDSRIDAGAIEQIVMESDELTLSEADAAFAESMIIAPEDADPPARRWAWLALTALLVLAIQVVHGFREQLAVHPTAGDYVQRGYAALGLPLQPRWDPTFLCTEAHGVAVIDEQLALETAISNRGPQAQPLPLLRVRLTDATGQTLTTHVVEPEDYLSSTDKPSLLAPNSRITAQATLEVDDPELAQYRLSLCYSGGPDSLRCAAQCRAN